MRFPANVVTKSDTRSDYPGAPGTPTQCLYCKAETGGPHKEDCGCIERPIKVRLTLDLIIAKPRGWGQEMIEFHLNESSWCANNILDEIARQANAQCLCGASEFEYVGEATLEEAVAAGLKPDSEGDGETAENSMAVD